MGITTVDRLDDVLKSITSLVQQEILVGVPDSTAGRKDDDQPISNAEIGYIQENGSPANNIPARPHLVPGVEGAQAKFTPQLEKGVQAALDGEMGQVASRLNAAGLIAQTAVRNKIDSGPFVPLSPLTLLARMHRQGGGTVTGKTLGELGAFVGPVDQRAVRSKPLIDTGQYRNSITYVVKKK
jgi:hypothetical protein